VDSEGSGSETTVKLLFDDTLKYSYLLYYISPLLTIFIL